jgi:hypothetical protein
MRNGARRVVLACVLVGTLGGAGFAAAPALAQQCHPAYGGCLPDYDGDALNCADIGYQVVQVWDVNNDPYNLDTLYGSGNGWTCDSYQ